MVGDGFAQRCQQRERGRRLLPCPDRGRRRAFAGARASTAAFQRSWRVMLSCGAALRESTTRGHVCPRVVAQYRRRVAQQS